MVDSVKQARKLRQSQTDAESLLWSKLRNRQLGNLKFRRQHPIPPYVVDFFCETKKLVIEVDGGQHNVETDKERTDFLENQGYSVLRFWNNEILGNIEGVWERIMNDVNSTSPHPALSRGERVHEGKRVCLGKIVGTHGVRGLVKVLPFGDDPELLKDITPLYINAAGDKFLALTFKNFVGKHILASIEGITNKEDAEALSKPELWVDRDELPEISDADEFYIEDLIGLAVFDAEKNELGHIVAVPDYGAGQMLEVKPTGGKRFLVPFTKDNVPEVDIQGGSVTIQNWEMYQLEA